MSAFNPTLRDDNVGKKGGKEKKNQQPAILNLVDTCQKKAGLKGGQLEYCVIVSKSLAARSASCFRLVREEKEGGKQ